MAQDTPSRDLEKIIVRLPDGMRDRLKAAAEANNRSVNAEVVARLEASFVEYDSVLGPLAPGANSTPQEKITALEALQDTIRQGISALAEHARKRASSRKTDT